MGFIKKSEDYKHQQVGSLYLRRWYAYEKHFDYFMNVPFGGRAAQLFQSLKQLTKEEVDLLAERYYKSTDYRAYDEELGDYTSVMRVTLKELSTKLEVDQEELRTRYREIEIKVGKSMLLF